MVAKGKRAKSSVWRGVKTKTVGGLTKDKLMMNKRGKVVSKAASAAAKRRCAHLLAWGKAVTSARKALDLQGFVAVGGKSAVGRALTPRPSLSSTPEIVGTGVYNPCLLL